jgi:8-amino-7-oxononanoate synthase
MRTPDPTGDDALDAARQAARRRQGRAPGPVPSTTQWPAAPPFDQLADYQSLERLREVGAAMDVQQPYFRLHEGHAASTTVIDQREVLNFASYDYVGLNADPRVAEAAKQAIDRYGVSPSGSRLVAGCRPVHDALETALARHYGLPAAMVFVSGHSTNVSTIGYLMGESDLVLYDSLSHNSIQVGMKLSGAARRSFAHNDMDALEALLIENRTQFRNALIVVEGLYSMDGDIPPLDRLIALKRKYGCWLMVDEAHALGCVGATGKGSFEACGINPADVDIWMGTLSKTLASTGGYIVGSRALIDLLRANASGYVYSVALAPALAASALRALEILTEDPARVRKLPLPAPRRAVGSGDRNRRAIFHRARHGGRHASGRQAFRTIALAWGERAAGDVPGGPHAGGAPAVLPFGAAQRSSDRGGGQHDGRRACPVARRGLRSRAAAFRLQPAEHMMRAGFPWPASGLRAPRRDRPCSGAPAAGRGSKVALAGCRVILPQSDGGSADRPVCDTGKVLRLVG